MLLTSQVLMLLEFLLLKALFHMFHQNCSLLSSPMEKLVISKLIFSWLNYLYAYVPHKSLSSIVMIVLCVQSLGLTHDPVQSRCSNHVCAIDLCARDVELALQHSIFDCDYFSHEKWYAGCIFQN